jgi:hypothetical protein
MLNAYFLMKKGNLIMELNGYKKGCTDDVMKLRVKKDLSAHTTFVIRPYITNAMHIGTPSASVAFSAFKVIDENPNRTSTALYRQR